MQWWNDFVDWVNSGAGWRVFSSAILPFVAIIVAAFLAAWIGRASARRVLDLQDRELKAAAIMALIGAGRKAAVWSSLGLDEKQHIDSLISEADIRVRLLPVNGANAAADWATHELTSMKKNSATFSFQADQTFFDYRDRLLEWQNKPKRARKLFAYDLEQWRYEDDVPERTPVADQEWTSDSAAKTATLAAAAPPVAPVLPVASPTPASGSFAPTATTPPATTPPPTTPTVVVPMTTTSADGTPSDDEHEEIVVHAEHDHTDSDPDGAVDDVHSTDSYAPPVTAGTVRRRIAPDEGSDSH
ncbi:MAG: hypothetical protein JWR36_1348 [Glaciihabitans sp.]|jgi:hypothetical protein|nr:hypothetical protein [Glaciihabitans sp.]MDQ1569493.1 hypothetical protein [Actinomycetota bacterium]